MALCWRPRGYASVLNWSLLGLGSAITQTATITAMYASSASSQAIMTCLILSVVFLVLYMAYLVVVYRLYSGITTWTPPHLLKYFLIVHLLIATCVHQNAGRLCIFADLYVRCADGTTGQPSSHLCCITRASKSGTCSLTMMAKTSSALRTVVRGWCVGSRLGAWARGFPGDLAPLISGLGLFIISAVLAIVMFSVTLLSLIIDAWGVHFHTKHAGYLTTGSSDPVSPAISGSSGRPRSGVWRRKPRVTAVASGVVDGVLLLCTIQALVLQVRTMPALRRHRQSIMRKHAPSPSCRRATRPQ